MRAWKSIDRFEGRAALRSWLYRIATNVCLDMLNGRQRRARPMDLGPAGSADAEFHARHAARGRLARADARLARAARGRRPRRARRVARDAAARLRQRAPAPAAAPARGADPARGAALAGDARWPSCSTPASPRSTPRCSARGRSSPTTTSPPTRPSTRSTTRQRELLDRYVAAFEQYDMDALIPLLQEDATLSMPPFDLWLQGADEVRAWFVGHGIGCKGSRLLPVNANGSPGLRPVPAEPRAAAGSRGRSRCSRSQTGGSPISTRSSTPSGCSRCSGCRPGSTRRTSVSPKRSSSSRSSREGSRSRTRQPSRRAVSWRRASASIVPASGCVSAGDVADEHLGARALELRARALAQGRRVGRGQRSADHEPAHPPRRNRLHGVGTAGSESGISTCTRVPAPGGLSISMRPSSAPTRSAMPRSPRP